MCPQGPLWRFGSNRWFSAFRTSCMSVRRHISSPLPGRPLLLLGTLLLAIKWWLVSLAPVSMCITRACHTNFIRWQNNLSTKPVRKKPEWPITWKYIPDTSYVSIPGNSTYGIKWNALPCAACSWVWLCVTPWAAARQAPLSTGFPRQKYWGGLPFPSPGDLPNSRSNSHFLHYRLVLYHWATWEARSPSIQQCMYEVAIVWIPPNGRSEPAGVKGKNLWGGPCCRLNHLPPNLCV